MPPYGASKFHRWSCEQKKDKLPTKTLWEARSDIFWGGGVDGGGGDWGLKARKGTEKNTRNRRGRVGDGDVDHSRINDEKHRENERVRVGKIRSKANERKHDERE